MRNGGNITDIHDILDQTFRDDVFRNFCCVLCIHTYQVIKRKLIKTRVLYFRVTIS